MGDTRKRDIAVIAEYLYCGTERENDCPANITCDTHRGEAIEAFFRIRAALTDANTGINNSRGD